jgi:hypothetical protein
MRVIALHFRKLFRQPRKLFIGALDLIVGVREPFIRVSGQGLAGFCSFRIRGGVHWRLPFRPMSSEGGRSTSRSRSVQSCPNNGRMMEEY